jgi:hypothetical protein
MRRKRRWMGVWSWCIDCNVQEFKWGILERVLLLLRNFIFVHFTKKYAQFHAHTYAECVQGITTELQVFSLNSITGQFFARNVQDKLPSPSVRK